MEQNQKRNIGIDLARIVSMLMIVILHIMGSGGILSNLDASQGSFTVAWFIDICCYCSVDLFGIISGYVGLYSRHRPKNIIKIWLQMLFYSVCSTAVFVFLFPDSFGLFDIIKSFFPVLTARNWYPTAYFILFFFMPFLNNIVLTMPKEKVRNLLLTIFVFFSVFQTLLGWDIFVLKNGYSVWWLSLLYLIGAYIRKYNIICSDKRILCVVVYLFNAVFVLLSKIVLLNSNISLVGHTLNSDVFISYISPFILINAICLFMLFSSASFKNGGAINAIEYISPMVLAVLLTHGQPNYYSTILTGKYAKYAAFSPLLLTLNVLSSAVSIFAVGIVLEYFRLKLFKMLKINAKVDKISEIISSKIGT